MGNEELHPVPPDEIPLEVIEYINLARRTPILTIDQEQELVKRIAQGDEIARIRMIEANLRLIVAMGKKYINQGLRFSDIVKAGNKGLIRAIEKYHLECGFKFSTYAAWWIKKAIEHAVVNQTSTASIPVHFADVETFEDILNVDLFVEHICIVCGFKGNVFPLPYMFYACPKCLNERIKELRQTEHVIPDWIIFLEEDSDFRKNRQTMVQEGHIFFYECGICNKAIMPDNARYYSPPGVHIGKPFCIECYDKLRSGK
jgi:RNA polymerase sigma factor (sigma-70 family)